MKLVVLIFLYLAAGSFAIDEYNMNVTGQSIQMP